MPVGGLFHQSMAGNAESARGSRGDPLPSKSEYRVMATETSVVLDFADSPESLRKVIIPPTRLPPPAAYAASARAVTILAGSFSTLIARVEQENFPHHRLGKFFKGRRVASLANFIANVGGRRGLGGFGFRRPDDAKENQQRYDAERTQAAQRFHVSSTPSAVRRAFVRVPVCCGL